MRTLWRMTFLAAVVLAIAAPAAWAGAAEVSFDPGRVHFDSAVRYERAVLTVSMPGGEVFRQEFDAGDALVFDLAAVKDAADGAYNYELRLTPPIAPSLRKALAEARRSGDEAEMARLRAQLPEAPVVSGSFQVDMGMIVQPQGRESTPGKKVDAVRNVTAADQVIPDDLIVQGSECVGLDCVNNENFGFDTIRLKENNTRIHFDDTSTSAGFPANDWRIIANDSASGGSNKFSIEDSTGAKTPFTITAGASTNSIFVDSTGRVGLRTSTPVLDLHIATSNTPAIRLEQNNSGGFTAQTWDIAGNEANFFVRDVTGGSRLPFRIRPGAPTSAIDISADGDVGIGTASPEDILTVNVAEAGRGLTITGDQTTDVSANMTIEGDSAGYILDDLQGPVNQKAAQQFVNANEWRLRGLNDALNAETIDGIVVSLSTGNVGVNCESAPGADLVVDDGGACNAGTRSQLNAGDVQFTNPSSRSLKEHLAPVKVEGILEKISNVDVYTYDFIGGPTGRIGLMAEDFHAIFGRGSDKMINGGEVQLALWLAVQELSAQNKELRRELDELKNKQ